ncbi:DNA-protecting protein DprA [Ferrimonas sediminicola]|uniref:DNA-protecting protein DprA n=1 Tax=Ferrimonas sediminicola TaxID=2569538 RepID=A0A4U1B9D6_9GAMM|nr:DNA-processing protein DprA [Ferrimonas sediminicola]TKB46968.1 DNA-protecting protein DprA [Ferrimonas sediminicola]
MAASVTDWLALELARGLGLGRKLKLLDMAPVEVLRQWALAGDLPDIHPGFAQTLAYPERRRLELALAWSEPPNRQILTLEHPDYPLALKQIADPPLLLFVEGEASLLAGPGLAVVGSRGATPPALERTHHWCRELAQQGWVIVSGLAEGIDAAAHRGALEGGATVAVTGCGLGHCYPRRHKELQRRIAEQGAVVSTFWPDLRPHKGCFPRRNRVVSGLCYGTLVMEAGVKSGSLITARMAAEQGREVFAVPGSVDNPQAAGCHFLIQQGAKLTSAPVDIYEELMPQLSRRPQNRVRAQVPELPLPRLLDSVGYEATSVDVVVARSDLPVDVVLEQLLLLELEGRVAQVPGGYIRLRGG